MEKNPLVSVIVPNYNYARYLDARIDSILRQTWTDFELDTGKIPEPPPGIPDRVQYPKYG